MAYPYEEPIDPEHLANIISLFKRQHASGAFPGGQIVVRHQGKMILKDFPYGHQNRRYVLPLGKDVLLDAENVMLKILRDHAS